MEQRVFSIDVYLINHGNPIILEIKVRTTLKKTEDMENKTSIKLFEQKQVRSVWNEEEEKWYFSVVDIIEILTDQTTHQGARNYWKVLKSRLLKEGNETVTNCNRLKLVAEDGKMRETDVANTEQLFRLIQSIPSPKAEPFKFVIPACS